MKYLQKITSSQKIKGVVTAIAVFTLLLMPLAAVHAQPDIFGGENAPEQFVGEDQVDVGEFIVSILEIVLSIVGLIAVVFLVWGGFKYMTASGDEERVKSAKGTMINAIIGLVIVLLAFAIIQVVATLLENT